MRRRDRVPGRRRPTSCGRSPSTSCDEAVRPVVAATLAELVATRTHISRPASSPPRSCCRRSPTPATSTSPTTLLLQDTPAVVAHRCSTGAPRPCGSRGRASTTTAWRTSRSTTTARGRSSTSCTATPPGCAPRRRRYRRFRVAPQPGGGLTSAEAEHDSPHGRIEVAWHQDDTGRTAIEVLVPPGTSAEIDLPDGQHHAAGPGRWHGHWTSAAAPPASPVGP